MRRGIFSQLYPGEALWFSKVNIEAARLPVLPLSPLQSQLPGLSKELQLV